MFCLQPYIWSIDHCITIENWHGITHEICHAVAHNSSIEMQLINKWRERKKKRKKPTIVAISLYERYDINASCEKTLY